MIAQAKTSLYAVAKPCRLRALSSTRMPITRRQFSPPPQAQRACVLPAQRQFSQSANVAYPRKDSQDKDSINTEATEYSKSATDDEGARQQDAAFDPNITDPQHQKEVAGKGTEGTDTNNPLDVSPANPEVSKQRGETEGGAESSSSSAGTTSDRQRSSGGGGPRKGSKVA